MFCNNRDVKINNIPFPNPIVLIVAEIVYPKQNPLNITIPNTIGIHIIVVPANHSKHANIIFSFMFIINQLELSISPFLQFSIYVFI